MGAQAFVQAFEGVAETLPNLLEALILTGFTKLSNVLEIPNKIPVTCEIS